MSEERASKAEIEEDERDMLERADHDDAQSPNDRAEAARRRKQTEQDRR